MCAHRPLAVGTVAHGKGQYAVIRGVSEATNCLENVYQGIFGDRGFVRNDGVGLD